MYGRTDGNPYRPCGKFGRAARRTRNAGGGDAVVGVRNIADAFGHHAHDLFAYHAAKGDRVARDAEQRLFGLVSVGHYASFEIGRCAGRGHQPGGDRAARAAFGHGERFHAFGKELVHSFFRVGAGRYRQKQGRQCENFIHGR